MMWLSRVVSDVFLKVVIVVISIIVVEVVHQLSAQNTASSTLFFLKELVGEEVDDGTSQKEYHENNGRDLHAMQVVVD